MGRFQCSMLDCIKDTMTAMDNIVNHRKENTQKLRDAFDQKKDIINTQNSGDVRVGQQREDVVGSREYAAVKYVLLQ